MVEDEDESNEDEDGESSDDDEEDTTVKKVFLDPSKLKCLCSDFWKL